jgi:hypothetical protein
MRPAAPWRRRRDNPAAPRAAGDGPLFFDLFNFF